MRDNTNMRAIPVQAIPRDKHRTYLVLFATNDVVVTISGGTPFTVLEDTQWGPQPAPINDITFSGTGTLVLG